MNKEKLLKLINEDDEIRDAVRNILHEEKPISSVEKDKEEIEMLKALVEKYKKCFSDEEVKTDTLTKELSKQKKSLTQDIAQLKQVKEELTDSNKELQSKQNKLTSMNSTLQNNVQQLQSDNKSIETSNTKLTKTIEFYRENFEDELKAYELFTSLTPNTRDSLTGIFKDSSLQGFLSCGVQDKNISSFWEYIKTELQEDKNSDRGKLVQIYDFLFQRYIRAFPMYELQKVHKGDEFEALAHINHSSSSAVSGTITEVLLQGYINTKTSKVIKQSVVKVG